MVSLTIPASHVQQLIVKFATMQTFVYPALDHLASLLGNVFHASIQIVYHANLMQMYAINA